MPQNPIQIIKVPGQSLQAAEKPLTPEKKSADKDEDADFSWFGVQGLGLYGLYRVLVSRFQSEGLKANHASTTRMHLSSLRTTFNNYHSPTLVSRIPAVEC